MKIAYSERLRSNYLLLEPDEEPSAEEVIRVGMMHSAVRSCCGGQVKVGIARMRPDGRQERAQFVRKRNLQRYLG